MRVYAGGSGGHDAGLTVESLRSCSGITFLLMLSPYHEETSIDCRDRLPVPIQSGRSPQGQHWRRIRDSNS